jgi:hypothetical protein
LPRILEPRKCYGRNIEKVGRIRVEEKGEEKGREEV